MLLTAAVAAGFNTVNAGYEISKLGTYMDFINLMTYDLHGNWDPITGHHTAMANDGGLLKPRSHRAFTAIATFIFHRHN